MLGCYNGFLKEKKEKKEKEGKKKKIIQPIMSLPITINSIIYSSKKLHTKAFVSN